jgi:UDP-glucose 4-epimerase
MKIVVTGALGHIGSRLIRELPKYFPGCEIVMIDNMSVQRYCSLFNLPNARYKFIEGDVLNCDLDRIILGANIVIHLAAITDAASSFSIKDKVESNNLNATVRVANACLKFGASLIFPSSTSVYGTQNDFVDENCSEEDLKPQSPYAETKLNEEKYIRSLKDLKSIVFRFGTICGTSPGMRFHTAVNKFCWQAVTGQPLTVWKTAFNQKRPYLSLDDCMSAIEFVIKKNYFDKQIYNVLTENVTVEAIITEIKTQIDEINIEYVDSQIMNQLSYEVLNKKLIDRGFAYKGSVNESIIETVKLFKSLIR